MASQHDKPTGTAAKTPTRSLEELLDGRSQHGLCVWRTMPVETERERKFLNVLRSVVQRGALHNFWEWTVLYWCGQSHAVNHAALSLGAVIQIKEEMQRDAEIPRETYDFLGERYIKALGLLQGNSEPIYAKMLCYLICICIEIFKGNPGIAFGLIGEGVALHVRLVTEENIPPEEADIILGFLAGSRTLCSQDIFTSPRQAQMPAWPHLSVAYPKCRCGRWLSGLGASCPCSWMKSEDTWPWIRPVGIL